jgi:glyoxylase-like metal-dependent hydrolase (beta-lactamase superfamily II)
VFDGVVRVTLPLPAGPRHVHAYLLEAADGWTAVDAGLGLPGTADTWREALGGVGPVTRIVITHFHPDHLGGAADLRALTGAPVLQSPRDAELTRLVWGDATWPERLAEWFERHGMPRAAARTIVDEARLYGPFIRYAADPEILDDEVAGWRVVPTPGHADGHVCLLRDGVLVAGDHLLADISPAVGLYPHGDPDPLGHYLESLALVESLEPRLVLPAHGEPFEDGAGRARELLAHHRDRLDETLDALSAERPRTAHDVSLDLFGERLVDDSSRRFAVAETLAHLERLVVGEAAARGFSDGVITYTRA